MNAELFEALRPVAERVGWALVHSVWEGFGVAAGLWVALAGMGRASARARYAACCAALAVMVVAMGVTFALVEGTRATGRDVAADEPLTPVDKLVSSASPVPGPRGAEAVVTPTPWDVRRQLVPWLPGVAAAWGAGVIGLAAWHFGGWLRLRRLTRLPASAAWDARVRDVARRMGVERVVRVVESAMAPVPAMVGFIRPVILLPVGIVAEMSVAQVEAILAHELAHVRRNDYLVNLVQTAVETLLFYHPAVWWVSGQIRQERENCCDDLAVAACGDPAGYARALARVDELRAGQSSLVMAMTGGSLLKRVRRIAGMDVGRGGAAATPVAAVVVTLACLAAVMVTAQLPTRAAETATAEKAAAATTRPSEAETMQSAHWTPALQVLLNQRDQLNLQLAELGQQVGRQHPRILSLMRQIETLQAKIDADVATSLAAKKNVPAATAPGSAIRPEDLVPEAKDYPIAASDLLSVSIAELTAPGVETVKAMRVSESGGISLPYVGQVKVAGLTPIEAEKFIAKRYVDAHIIQNAQVSVQVTEARSNTFSIVGPGIARAGQYPITRSDLRLAEALAAAGGAGSSAVIRIVRGKGDEQRRIEVTMKSLLAGDKAVNLIIRPGDMLLVSEPERRVHRIIVGRDQITFDGQPMDLPGVEAAIRAIPDGDRARTLLEVGAAGDDVPFGRFMQMFGTCINRAQELGMPSVSNIGVVRGSASPASKAAVAP